MTVITFLLIVLISIVLALALIGGLLQFFMGGMEVRDIVGFCIILFILIVFLKIIFTGSFTL